MMISELKLRNALKPSQLAGERLDEILARNPNFLDPIKEERHQDLGDVDFKNSDVFHRAITPVLIMAQWFSVMPVVGVSRPNPKDLKFSFRCPQMALTLTFLTAGLIFVGGMANKLIHIGINAKNFVGLAFFICVFLANFLFLSLAKRWPNLMQCWTKTELIFIKPPYIVPKRNLTARIRFSATIIVLLSFVEHSLYLLSSTYSYIKHNTLCNTTHSPSFADYMQTNYDYVYYILPFNIFTEIAPLIINVVLTFIWNYMDLFIMVVSKGIAYRFEQIGVRIRSLSEKEVPEYVFSDVRDHYVLLCELLEYVDQNLSGIILLSCINNLYFVCYQLLNIFNKLRWPINYIYFWYSLIYLIGRTAFVFLSAASINDESSAPTSVLRRVSKQTWCIEVERLIFQMTTQTVALSGKKFYYLTRRLLFGMAGTIVTYELVLLQFDEPNRAEGLPDLCS